MDIKIEHEGDIINLIGLNTVLKFHYISDAIITFKTVKPLLIDDVYYDFVVEFFAENDVTKLEFFCYDSFSEFLIKYRIHQLSYELGDINVILYRRKYDD